MKKYIKYSIFIAGILVLVIVGGCFFVKSMLNQYHESGTTPADVSVDHGNCEPDHNSNNGNKKTDTPEKVHNNGNSSKSNDKSVIEDNNNTVSQNPYMEMIRNSNRINIICLGIARYLLADVIIAASIEPDTKEIDLISIPRDTYLYREGYDHPEQKKINSAYQSGSSTAQRAQSCMNGVRDLLQIPIHHFVKIEYEGVEKIIDTIDGVGINIPFDMNYDDPVDDLHIHFTKGYRLLKGDEAIEYLRFRKNNDGTEASDGDMGRIKRQQTFVLIAIKKCLGLNNLIEVVNISKRYIKTSLTPDEILTFTKKFSNISENNIEVHTLPVRPYSENNLEYYVHDPETVKKFITGIYTNK